jgi:peptide/nickel transport system substrate-binding protein
MTSWGGTALAFNLDDATASDPDLREALLLAFNAEQITSSSYPGEKPVTAYFPEDAPYRDDDAGVYPEFDLAGAQKAFDAYLDKVGKDSLELTMLGYAEYPIMVQVAEVIQSQLNQIEGLQVSLESMAGLALNAAIREGKYQIAMANAASSQNPKALYRAFHTDGDMNVTGYSDPEVDAALETVQSTEDPEAIAKAYELIGGRLSTDAPYRLFAQEKDIIIVAKNVHGVNPVSLGAVTSELLWIG